MSSKDEKEKTERLKALLSPINEDVRRVSKAFKISYSEAADLLNTYHLNDVHFMMNVWFQANVGFSKNPKPD